MNLTAAQYIQILRFTNDIPDQAAWEDRLVEVGLAREAFHIANGDGAIRLEFWEPDRVEALRVLARLDRLQ
jgi:hypothetical protein